MASSTRQFTPRTPVITSTAGNSIPAVIRRGMRKDPNPLRYTLRGTPVPSPSTPITNVDETPLHLRRSDRIRRIVNTPSSITASLQDNLGSPQTTLKRKQAAVALSADEASSDDENRYHRRRQSYGRSRAPRTPKQRKTVMATKQESPDHSTHSTSKVWLYFKTTAIENTNAPKDRWGRLPMVSFYTFRNDAANRCFSSKIIDFHSSFGIG
jgi:hypothetical protein